MKKGWSDCLKILAALKKKKRGVTSAEMREMGVYSPAQRVKELRQSGYEIGTVIVEVFNGDKARKLALYTLHGEPDTQRVLL